MGTDSDNKDMRQKQRVPMDRRSGLERRSGIERRIQDLDPPDGKERRSAMNRRSGLDRRSGVDRRLNIHDQSTNTDQSTYEINLAIESKGLFSRIASFFKRWFN